MKKRSKQDSPIKSILTCLLPTLFLLGFGVSLCLLPQKEYSDAERRPYAVLPAVSKETFLNGELSEQLDPYLQDHFPLRQQFRSLKAFFQYAALQQQDNNGIYFEKGHLGRLEYPLNEVMLSHSLEQINKIYDLYLQNSNCSLYISVIPDKNYYLAKNAGYPVMDYDKLFETVQENTPQMTYIDITDTLTYSDFYRTDIHWKQENLLETASKICNGLSVSCITQYKTETLDVPFYGVLASQSALPVAPDTIQYLTNDLLKACNVTYLDSASGKSGLLYDIEKAHGKDAYELFLSGNHALITVDNPNASTDRELILFRDSFGSSLCPLILQDYAKVTLVDIRYVNTEYLGNLITFSDQDVYFLYSTHVLQSSAL